MSLHCTAATTNIEQHLGPSNAGMAAKEVAVWCCSSYVSDIVFRHDRKIIDSLNRQEAATADPTSLAQETIIENMNPAEYARLSKVRNIGIAVR